MHLFSDLSVLKDHFLIYNAKDNKIRQIEYSHEEYRIIPSKESVSFTHSAFYSYEPGDVFEIFLTEPLKIGLHLNRGDEWFLLLE